MRHYGPAYEKPPPTHKSVLGRWQSVGPTTARRNPSARKRPGVVCFPHSAPGRPREEPRRSAPSIGRRRAASAVRSRQLAGRTALKPMRRRRREPFRVYAEDDFFENGASAEFADALGAAHASGRPRRLAGLAALAGAVGAVGAVTVTSFLPLARGTARKTRARTYRAAAPRANAAAHDSGQVTLARPGVRRPSPRRRATPRDERSRIKVGAAYALRAARRVAGARSVLDAPKALTHPIDVSFRRDPPPQHSEFGFER
jgi:hypothetical protein